MYLMVSIKTANIILTILKEVENLYNERKEDFIMEKYSINKCSNKIMEADYAKV